MPPPKYLDLEFKMDTRIRVKLPPSMYTPAPSSSQYESKIQELVSVTYALPLTLTPAPALALALRIEQPRTSVRPPP
eukprot:2639348-Prymnesium_polylepis.1